MSTAVSIKVAGNRDWDDEAVASLLRDVKTIAAKEVEVVDPVAKSNNPNSPMLRGRTIFFATEELARGPSGRTTASPLLSPASISPVRKQPRRAVLPDLIEHHDWSNRVGSYKESVQLTIKKQSKQKDGSFVGQIPRAKVRATLRRKFSWKQYPEVRR